MHRVDEGHKNTRYEEVALGFGDNIDYEIHWDSKVFERLVIDLGIRNDELSADQFVQTERDLVISILGFVKSGNGGERIVGSSDVLEQFSRRFDKNVTLGGTGPRAAVAMRKLGITSALHLVTINDYVRELIPPDSQYVCSSTKDTLYPHVIVQFGLGTRVQAGDIDIHATQANRIIYHKDEDNIAMQLDDGFSDLIRYARALLVSGFNAMQSEELLETRLRSLARITDNLPRDALIFYEDAGYYDPTFRYKLLRFLAGTRHVVSVNEDELQEYLGRKVDILDAIEIVEALEDLQKLMPSAVVVVHTRYWALAYGKDATAFSEALNGGITMATTRFCYGDSFTAEHYADIKGLPGNKAGKIFSQAVSTLLGKSVCCLPVASVDQGNATTIGLGDAFVGGFLATCSSVQ